MPRTMSTYYPRILNLYVSADEQFAARLRALQKEVENKKTQGVSKVDWCLIHLLDKARASVCTGPEPKIDLEASRAYIIDTYGDEGIEVWEDVFNQAVTALMELNTPHPDSL